MIISTHKISEGITLTVTVFYPPRLRLLFQVQFTIKNKVAVFFTHHQTIKIFWFEFPVFHIAGRKNRSPYGSRGGGNAGAGEMFAGPGNILFSGILLWQTSDTDSISQRGFL